MIQFYIFMMQINNLYDADQQSPWCSAIKWCRYTIIMMLLYNLHDASLQSWWCRSTIFMMQLHNLLYAALQSSWCSDIKTDFIFIINKCMKNAKTRMTICVNATKIVNRQCSLISPRMQGKKYPCVVEYQGSRRRMRVILAKLGHPVVVIFYFKFQQKIFAA